jgi:hypothetical protein
MGELLSLPKMARRVGVTQAWLREQADRGVVPCLIAGNRYLFASLIVEETLLRQAAGSESETACVS